MSRRIKYPWDDMRKAYVSGQCDSYRDVAKRFQVNVKRVEERASPKREGWYAQRVRQDEGVLQSALAALKEEDADRLARLFKDRTEASTTVMERALKELKKKTSIATADIPSFLLAAARLSDPVMRAAEVSSKLNADKTDTDVHIHAPNASVVNVQQLLAFIGKKRGVRGFIEEDKD